jgi:hypothetical protein
VDDPLTSDEMGINSAYTRRRPAAHQGRAERAAPFAKPQLHEDKDAIAYEVFRQKLSLDAG